MGEPRGSVEVDVVRSLLENAEKFPQKVALDWGTSRLTYEELASKVGRTAAQLQAQGLSRGDFGVLGMDGSPESVILHYGMMFLGMVSVPINPSTPRANLETMLKKIRPGLIYLPRKLAGGKFATLADKSLRVCLTNDDSGSDHSLMPASTFIQQACKPEHGPDISGSWIVLALFTTGTTGASKGVMLTLDNISSAANNINEFTRLSESDTEVMSLPMYHSFGLGRLRCILHNGCRGYILKSFFRPEILLKTISREKATVFAQVPAGMRLLTALGDRIRNYTQTIRLIEIGSAPMTIGEKRRMLELFPGARICHHYGLTEASRSLFIEYSEAERLGKLESIGKPSPNAEVKLVKSKHHPENVGTIAIRGPHVSVGYLKDDASRGYQPIGEWLNTDDIGRIDDDGYYYHLGRESDIINIGGYKVNPSEVEEALNEHRSIKESAVVGVSQSDPGSNGQIVAFVVPCAGSPFPEENVRSYLKAKLEPYKLPDRFILVVSLPRTASGKLRRQELTVY